MIPGSRRERLSSRRLRRWERRRPAGSGFPGRPGSPANLLGHEAPAEGLDGAEVDGAQLGFEDRTLRIHSAVGASTSAKAKSSTITRPPDRRHSAVFATAASRSAMWCSERTKSTASKGSPQRKSIQSTRRASTPRARALATASADVSSPTTVGPPSIRRRARSPSRRSRPRAPASRARAAPAPRRPASRRSPPRGASSSFTPTPSRRPLRPSFLVAHPPMVRRRPVRGSGPAQRPAGRTSVFLAGASPGELIRSARDGVRSPVGRARRPKGGVARR